MSFPKSWIDFAGIDKEVSAVEQNIRKIEAQTTVFPAARGALPGGSKPPLPRAVCPETTNARRRP